MNVVNSGIRFTSIKTTTNFNERKKNKNQVCAMYLYEWLENQRQQQPGDQ